MLKYLIFVFIPLALQCSPVVERFQFEGHDYLEFECKAVLHDPECTRCLFRSYVVYDPQDVFDSILIIQRVKTSPLRENYFHIDY